MVEIEVDQEMVEIEVDQKMVEIEVDQKEEGQMRKEVVQRRIRKNIEIV